MSDTPLMARVLRGVHVMRDGDGTTVYLGRHQGARYVSVNLVGFDVWRSSRRMPGGWWAFEPTISTGRLFMDCSRRWSVSLMMPAKLRDFYYWKVRPSGRRFMREHAHDEPQRAAAEGTGPA